MPSRPIPYFSFQFPVKPYDDGFVCGSSVDSFNVFTFLDAYSKGIFPWFIELGLVHWFSPFPRAVLFTNEVFVSKSMQKLIRKNQFTITMNTALDEVIKNCAAPRSDLRTDTWIDEHFVVLYRQLFELKILNTVEVWQDGVLVGGLIGNIIDNMAYGETMFHTQANASKIALIHWCSYLQSINVPIIDCQQRSTHLISMGAKTISQEEFYTYLPQPNPMFNPVLRDKIGALL